jgi:hypothetical protein
VQEKMIVDFDYLSLPIPGGVKKARNFAPKVDRNALFDKLDTNHDGTLSFAEFSVHRDPTEAAMWFKARDRNGDGFLSREKFVATDVSKPAMVGQK